MHVQGPVRTYVAPDICTKKHHERPRTAKHRACASELRASRHSRQSQQRVWFYSLPFQRFQALLTLFLKSFSSFPHGTCSLSVLGLYLALDEIYHLIYAPSPRNVTLRTCAVHSGHRAKQRTLTQVYALFQDTSARATDSAISAGYNPKPGQNQSLGFKPERFPVRSPLLRESCLVPFPPLTCMLKFSGFACLTSCYGRSARSTVARPQASATSPTHIPENGCGETTKHVHACTKATPVARRWQTRQQHSEAQGGIALPNLATVEQKKR